MVAIKINDPGLQKPSDYSKVRMEVFERLIDGTYVLRYADAVPAGHEVEFGIVNNNVPLQIPELTTADRNAVSAPRAGMFIYNTTTAEHEIYTGSIWKRLMSIEINGFAASDEDTAITVGTSKITFRMPFAMHVIDIRANMKTAPTGASAVFDVNEAGTSILSTKLSIDATEKTSVTAATPLVISDSTLADDAEMTIDFDQVGATVAGTGVKFWLYGYKI